MNGVRTAFGRRLDLLCVWTVRSHAFFFSESISTFAKLPAFGNALSYHGQYLWKIVHPTRPTYISSPFPTNHECEVNSLRPFTTFWQNLKCPCSSCPYTPFWKDYSASFPYNKILIVTTIFRFIRCKFILFKKAIFGFSSYISVYEKISIL